MTTLTPPIRLRNSLSRKVEEFSPHDAQNVQMYVCGPTVYDRAHLGNARPVVVFDVLYRLLRHVYGAEHVTYVRNFTDVDDKINAEALRRQKVGATGTLEDLIRARTEETIGWYHADMDALGTLRPDHEPRATEWIGAMIAMIEGLIAKGHAYEAKGHVLFRVRSYAEYGALSGRSVDDMIAGARVEVAPYKEDPLDFVLWKPSDGDLPGWDSPWGRGRPGWHIECSAMSRELLGESFDIHGGGIDLQFPHHENEIAQSRCAHPDAGFARYWLHNEMVMVDGKKMSKSLGNFFTVKDLLDQNIDGEVIRFVLLSTHYRRPMDWTDAKLQEATGHLTQWGTLRSRLQKAGIEPRVDPSLVDEEFLAAIANDLNVPLARARLAKLMIRAQLNSPDREAVDALYSSLDFLGFKELAPHRPARRAVVDRAVKNTLVIEPLLERLATLRAGKSWQEADALRDKLIEAGMKLQIERDGEIVLDPASDIDFAKLDSLL